MFDKSLLLQCNNIGELQVEPLFQLADINAQVIYTQHANHAKEHVEGMNEYDWKVIQVLLYYTIL